MGEAHLRWTQTRVRDDLPAAIRSTLDAIIRADAHDCFPPCDDRPPA